MMEETPLVTGMLRSGNACICDKTMIHELKLKWFGKQEDKMIILKPFESLYLLYIKKLVLKKGKRQIGFDDFMHMCQEDDPDILTKFLIYRDLRGRGYVVKDGFGFGSDFRVYEKGQFGSKGAKFLIFGFSEGRKERMGAMQKKIEQITQMGKEPIVAVIERRGEIIYYKANRMIFFENQASADGPFLI